LREPLDTSDPTIARLVAELDPEVIAAAEEADRSLIRELLALTPLERVDRAARIAAMLRRYRRADG
jgi:hypothetical protein